MNPLLITALQAVMKGQRRATQDRYYPAWHLAPVTGLLNDPNGFIHFQGRYHLFYQWNPLGCEHKNKCWGHWSSPDLVHWQHEPIALMPENAYDRNGCYSGSAVDFNGTLTLCYTGNVKFDDGGRTAWQCLAYQKPDGTFEKTGPVLPLPEGYTGHVRDPKVWRHENTWYMVLGAQNSALEGRVLLLCSEDLHNWALKGEIAGGHVGTMGDGGYMWECPDLFPLGAQDVLICCPQGLPRESTRFLNTYPCVWFAGKFDYTTASYSHGAANEVDVGFEFYAPQTTLSADGRRLLFGWMGVPDGEEMLQPTRESGWIHQMTCPRELTWQQDQLWQRPARELMQLRGNHHHWQGPGDSAPVLDADSTEVVVRLTGDITLNFADTLMLDCQETGLRLSRRSLESGEWVHRYWQGQPHQLQILCDHSSVEIFINDGAGVMSSRYFPEKTATLTFGGTSEITVDYWPLKACMVE